MFYYYFLFDKSFERGGLVQNRVNAERTLRFSAKD